MKTNQYFKDAKANFIMKDRCCKAIQVVYEKYYNLAISKGRTIDEAKKRGIENAADCDRPPIWGTIELCKAYAAHCNKVQYRDITHYFCYAVISNENNTSDQRFFATVGTGVKAYWVSDSGVYESSIDVTGGSVTNDGALYLDFESDGAALNINLWEDAAQISEQEYDEAVGKDVGSSKVYMDQLPIFEVTTTSIMEGEWKRDCGLKEGNLSPELTWQPVEGATKYAVIMLDVSTNNWLSWYVITDKTHLDEGEYTDQSVYVGPYPAETHTYELYVVALKGDPQELNFPIDTSGVSGGDIHQKMDFLNTASDGSTGNVIAYGNITAPYTSPELYYGYR